MNRGTRAAWALAGLLAGLLLWAGTAWAVTTTPALPVAPDPVSEASRGMALFWAGCAVLAVLPFLGRNTKTLGVLGASALLARGLMRILSEHDVSRVAHSMASGLVLGLQLAAGLWLLHTSIVVIPRAAARWHIGRKSR